ncbi:tyrosine-protein kinase CSK-like isoform X2 [Dysidea avara]|uniref:tyrosine-protein kinase CSK-like isoform X2 n=1 Tax=Dysidea avara TaxID=196820 RepID=UPI00332D6C8C
MLCGCGKDKVRQDFKKCGITETSCYRVKRITDTIRHTIASTCQTFSLGNIGKSCATPLMGSVPSEKLNDFIKQFPYDLIKKTDEILGSGRFGDCTVGYFQGRKVCIKTYHDQYSSQQSLRMIIKEANHLARLSHGYVCYLQGVQVDRQPYYLVTNLYEINGESITIHDLLQNKEKSTVKELLLLVTAKSWLDIFYKIAEGLKYLHHHNIIHRDLKTDNVVFYTDSGIQVPVIVDFGKCQHVSRTQKYSLTKHQQEEYRSKHQHIAPDLIDGTNRPSPKSDIYSYGRMFRTVVVNYPISRKSISPAIIELIKSCVKYESSKRPCLENIITCIKTGL